MSDPQQTVFISYRRDPSAFIARAIYQDLRAHGYDVFLDVESIDNGPFDETILQHIAAREHFLLILTIGTLDRCHEQGDWIRREVEAAIRLKRNVVPILVDDLKMEQVEKLLIGDLIHLKTYNALKLPYDFFEAAMERLRTRFLIQRGTGEVQPISSQQLEVVQQKQQAADNLPAITPQDLSAEEYYQRGQQKGLAGDSKGAIADYDAALQLKPTYAQVYNNRGHEKQLLGDLVGAMLDYNDAIRYNDHYAIAYSNRATLRQLQGDRNGAIEDYNIAITLTPDYPNVYYNRATLYQAQGKVAKAVADYERYLALGGGEHYGDQAVIEAVIQKLRE